MSDIDEHFFRDLYAAFNRREIDVVIAAMHPDVDWPNGFEGGREHGHDAVRAYWTRQFELIDSQVEPVRVRPLDDGRVAVDVHQVVRAPGGDLLSDRQVVHIYTLRDGLVERMDIAE